MLCKERNLLNTAVVVEQNGCHGEVEEVGWGNIGGHLAFYFRLNYK